MTNPIEVTQADRDAAADMAERDVNGVHLGERSWHIRDGHLDGDYRVQAFARHRIEAQTVSPVSGEIDTDVAAVVRKLMSERAALQAQVARLREALERLGSMEAFTMTRAVDHPQDDELIARIDFARAALTDPSANTGNPIKDRGGEDG